MRSQSEDEPHGGFEVPLHDVFGNKEKILNKPVYQLNRDKEPAVILTLGRGLWHSDSFG